MGFLGLKWKNMIEIDCSNYEEGGQILRTAFALSAITKKDCRVFNMGKTGLTPQNLLVIQSLAKICKGKIEGDKLGSEEVRFFPEELIQNQPIINIKIEAANSITLALQTLVLPALFISHPLKIIFEGGATDTFFSPTIDYFQQVLLKILEMMNLKTEICVKKRGYYPEGGGELEATIHPSKLKGMHLIERGSLKKIKALSGASESLKDKKVAERQLAGVREVLGKLKLPIEEKIEYYNTLCPGSQICLVAEFENTVIGTDNLGKLGKRAEDIGKEAALELLKESKTNACLDKHSTEQILPYLALAPGKSQISVSEITDSCRINIQVIEKFLNGKFKIKGDLIAWIP